MKRSKTLCGLIAILGITLLATFFTILYSYYYLYQPFPFEPSVFLKDIFAGFLLVGGIVFLIVGLLGVGNQHFKNHKRLFTVLIFVLVSLFVFSLIFQLLFFAPLSVAGIDPYERMCINQVIVKNTEPLVLTLSMRSLYSQDITIIAAYVKDNNQTTYAHVEGKWTPPDSEGIIQ